MSRQGLNGARAVVTGAGRGIGRAVAERLAAEGADLVVVDRDPGAVDDTVVVLRAAGAKVEGFAADVSSLADVDALVGAVGEVDVVVANAGVQSFARAVELTTDSFDQTMAVNARGTLLTLQLAARAVRDGGSVVTVASVMAHRPAPLSADYAASKAAVLSLTRTFADALTGRRIRVNAVAPGRIETDMSVRGATETGRLTGTDPDAALRARVATTPLGRVGRADEVAAAVAFLASDDASFITGECLNVCGGDVMP